MVILTNNDSGSCTVVGKSALPALRAQWHFTLCLKHKADVTASADEVN